MSLASLGGGIATAGVGGLLTGLGQNQQGSALRRAGRTARRNAEAAGRELTTDGAFTTQGIQRLGQEGQGLQANRVNAYGPGYLQAFQAAVPQASQTTAGGAEGLQGLIRRRPNYQNAGAGIGTSLAASRLEHTRAAPGRNLRNLQLAHSMTQPFQQQAGLDYGVGMAGLGRQGQEISADQGFRREGILGRYGLSQQQAGFQAQDAGQAGAGMSALGQFATGLAPGLAAIGARTPPPPPSVTPPPATPPPWRPPAPFVGRGDLNPYGYSEIF